MDIRLSDFGFATVLDENVVYRGKPCTQSSWYCGAEVLSCYLGLMAGTPLTLYLILSELLGTPGYLSPEMIKANSHNDKPGYGIAVDMWACGVVLYTLIAGAPPFYHRKPIYMLRDIMNGKYSFSNTVWEDVSPECKDLVRIIYQSQGRGGRVERHYLPTPAV